MLAKEAGKPPVSRERRTCQQCNTVHNKHKDAPNGCRLTKSVGPQISTSSTSSKKKSSNSAPDRESSSDSEESEQGEVFPLALSSDGSRSSSDFEPSESSSDEEESECHDQNRENIILNHIDDLRIDGDESSSSFHDSSSDDSSDGDMDMPDLFTDSDESDMEPAVDPNLDVHNDDNWTYTWLENPAGGKFVPGRNHFPVFNPPAPPGPVNIPPATFSGRFFPSLPWYDYYGIVRVQN